MSAALALHAVSGRLKWVAGCLFLAVFAATAADWPQYRGPNHDGVSTDRINKQWSGSVTNPLWLVPLTNGLTSFSVSGGRVFTQVRRLVDDVDKEVCIALSTTDGSELWARVVDDNATYSGGVGDTDDGPRTTPTVDGDSVYVASSYLNLYRLNVTNGAVIWHKNLQAIYGCGVIEWQNAASPLLEDGLIFINTCAGSSNLMALRTSDGEPAWRSQNEAMTHSTPVLTTMHGVRQVIFATQRALVSLNPQTGALLWKFNHLLPYQYSIGASPVVSGDIVFITANYAMGAVAARVVNSNATLVAMQLWRSASLISHWATPICYQGFLFGQFTPDNADAQLRCINITNGALKWAVGGFGRGSVLLVDGHLLAITERGELVLAKPSTNAYTEVARFLAIPDYYDAGNKCWNAPAVSDGRVYVRSTAYGACFDFSMPGLKLDPPQPVPANQVQLTIRTANGTPLDSNRLTGMEVRAATDAGLALAQWSKLTNALTLTDGVVRVTNVDAGPPGRFFIVSEPK